MKKITSPRASSLLPILAALAFTACPDDEPARTDTQGPPDTVDTSDSDDTPDAGDSAADSAVDADITPLPPEQAFEQLEAAFCPAYAQAFCARVEPCGCTDAPGYPTDCLASFEAACARELQNYREPILSGQAVTHPENVAACMAAFTTVAEACVTLPNDLFFVLCPILAPPGGFTDLPGLDAPCQGLCATGLRCTADNVCKVPGAANAPCATPYDCATDLVCADGTCQPPRQADIGKACAGPEGCTGDTTCIASARKICRAPALADTCRWDEDCPTHAYCLVDQSAEPPGPSEGVCTAAPGAGELCANGVVCGADLACGEDLRCAPLPVLDAPCASGRFGPTVCAAGLSCVDFVCKAPPTEGQTCALGEPHCAAGLGCAFEGDNNVCRAKRDAGGACDNDLICNDGLYCNFSKQLCEPFLAVGAPCKDGNECGPEGSCLPDAVFDFRCADKPGKDGVCFLEDCEAGLICRTPYAEGVCAPVLCESMRF